MTRHIYLAIYSNGPRPAHQALFIPTKNTGTKGKIIHVTGNTATGFFLQFKRNYDFAIEDRKYQLTLLAEVDDATQRDTDTVGNGEPVEDTIARDLVESVATTVLPPGRSPNPFGPDVGIWFLGESWVLADL